MKHLKTGENSYYWYKREKNGFSKTPSEVNGKTLISQSDLGPLLDAYSKGSPLREMQRNSIDDDKKDCHVSNLKDTLDEEKFKKVNEYFLGTYSTIDWNPDSLKEYYDHFSKPTYTPSTTSKPGTYSIKYF